jgi:membrane-bound metal-dependent hydrolase YbcI (DUF457 family)
MDIVTHALMGVAVAGPCLITAPAASAGFILGSVLPDLDAFSRIFGKKSFLTWHQTFTHSLGAMLTVAMLGFICLTIQSEIAYAFFGISAGMLFHSLLDYTNTFGVKLCFPFSQRRQCLEWVFFIDAVTIILTALMLAILGWSFTTESGPSIWQTVIYLVLLISYFLWKGWLRTRAIQKIGMQVESLIPSAFLPWRFMGYRRLDPSQAQLIDFNVLWGSITKEENITILDEQWQATLASSSYFLTMRQLSIGYHIVSDNLKDDGNHVIRCRDLRTRNFGTTFGELDIIVTPTGEIVSQILNV